MSDTKLDVKNLIKQLEKLGFKPELQNETNQIFFINKTETVELAFFLKVLAEGELLQIVTYLPVKLSKEQFSDSARLLNYINNDLDIPGFSLNESSKLIFYRVITPFCKKEFNKDLFDQYIKVCLNAATTFLPVINAVSTGSISYEELLKKLS
jgi:hypothetical protein